MLLVTSKYFQECATWITYSVVSNFVDWHKNMKSHFEILLADSSRMICKPRLRLKNLEEEAKFLAP